MSRDYKKEYEEYHSLPEQKKNRAKRNKANRNSNTKPGQEVDHKVPLSQGGSNSPSNWRVVSKETNRKKGSKKMKTAGLNKLRVALLSGSTGDDPEELSRSRALAEVYRKELEAQGASVDWMDMRDMGDMPDTYDWETEWYDDYRKRLTDADAMVISTPIFNYGPSGKVLQFLHRTLDKENQQYKPYSLLSGAGSQRSAMALGGLANQLDTEIKGIGIGSGVQLAGDEFNTETGEIDPGVIARANENARKLYQVASGMRSKQASMSYMRKLREALQEKTASTAGYDEGTSTSNYLGVGLSTPSARGTAGGTGMYRQVPIVDSPLENRSFLGFDQGPQPYVLAENAARLREELAKIEGLDVAPETYTENWEDEGPLVEYGHLGYDLGEEKEKLILEALKRGRMPSKEKTAAPEGVERLPSGGIKYRGETFPGYNKPKQAPAGSKHKKRVLAKKGDEVKVVNFGARGYKHNYSPEAKKNYLARSAGIKGKDDKFSANYWSRRELWPKNQKADGSSKKKTASWGKALGYGAVAAGGLGATGALTGAMGDRGAVAGVKNTLRTTGEDALTGAGWGGTLGAIGLTLASRGKITPKSFAMNAAMGGSLGAAAGGALGASVGSLRSHAQNIWGSAPNQSKTASAAEFDAEAYWNGLTKAQQKSMEDAITSRASAINAEMQKEMDPIQNKMNEYISPYAAEMEALNKKVREQTSPYEQQMHKIVEKYHPRLEEAMMAGYADGGASEEFLNYLRNQRANAAQAAQKTASAALALPFATAGAGNLLGRLTDYDWAPHVGTGLGLLAGNMLYNKYIDPRPNKKLEKLIAAERKGPKALNKVIKAMDKENEIRANQKTASADYDFDTSSLEAIMLSSKK